MGWIEAFWDCSFDSAEVKACSLLELVAALTSVGMLICRLTFENLWLFSRKEHIINSAFYTSLLNFYGKPSDVSRFWEAELKILQKQIPHHIPGGIWHQDVASTTFYPIVPGDCCGLGCGSVFLGTHQPFPVWESHWSSGVMVNLGALRSLLSRTSIVTLPNESKKPNYTFLMISMSLTLQSVALCVTYQACHKPKKEKKLFYQHWGWNVWWGHSRLLYVRLMHSY